MRAKLALGAVVLAAACSPQVPDSGAGFQDYNSYLKENSRPAAQPAAPVATSAPLDGTAPAPAPGGFSTTGAAAAIDRATGTAPAADPMAGTAPAPTYTPAPAPQGNVIGDSSERPRGNAPSTIQEDTGEMAASHAGMSDEQDFGAVSARESIASDKARIERNKAEYTVDQPGALPQRSGDEGPNLAQYALNTTNLPGQSIYKRSSLGLSSPERACAKYASPDLAQQAFLEAGGPEKDRKGLDPDGDGFACAWDPRPFRAALQ